MLILYYKRTELGIGKMEKYSSAFGKNDIRGIYNETIDENLYTKVGQAFVKYVQKKSGKTPEQLNLSVCRDARLHSKSLSDALIKGLVSEGANVIDMGLAPTPIGYYSEFAGVNGQKIDGALIVTASHNPPKYNGLKMTYNHQSLNESQIQEVKEITFGIDKLSDKKGNLKEYNLIKDYQNDMINRFGQIGIGVKVVVDSANATGGIVAPQLYRELGCNVVELFSEPDGNFPNHHPNPSDLKTLDVIRKKVVEEKADLGIAFDGDSDRIGIIDSKGNAVTGDKLLLIYAKDIIDTAKENNTPMPKVVSEVKCSQVLYDKINEYGGEAIMCKTGHGFIKGKMKETGAILAGEMSGHTFFKDRYYGFDDAVYAGCRIIEIVAKHKKQDGNFKVENLLKPFEEVFSSEEVRLSCPNELKKPTLEAFEKLLNSNRDLFGETIKDIITLDGLRIIFDDGFALIRQSNTEPVFTLRFEASTQELTQKYENTMVSTINNIMKG